MKLTDLLDAPTLAAMIAQGYVSVRTHPTEPLSIYNYTAAAQYDGMWNDVTRTCRGLIVNHETGEVVARPLAKFFTWGQPECPDIPLDAMVHVADKQDGSLGILYPTSDGLAVATRGSFTSEQALHATELLRTRYDGIDLVPGYTYLFEIVYPGNRIVLDYGDLDALVLLGYVCVDTGEFVPAEPRHGGWVGQQAQSFGWMTFEQALEMEPRDGAEGLVIQTFDGTMIKIKQADYVALHRILTNVTARTLWEHLAVNATHATTGDVKQTARRLHLDTVRVQQVLAAGADWERAFIADTLPDEFHGWVSDRVRVLRDQQFLAAEVARVAFERMSASAAGDRKTFAAQARKTELPGLLFALLDGRDITAETWMLVYPPHEKPFETQSEEVA